MWPKRPVYWTENKTLYISVPFTWNLPEVRSKILQKSFFYNKVIVGGPAIQLLPNYLADIEYVEIRDYYPNVLQKINPLATRTTLGCVRKCKFCGIGQGKIEGEGFKELSDWPDLPIICDNNLLACSQVHFDKVMDRLEKWDVVDFNQGLDARLLTDYHAERLARLKKAIIRLALDSMRYAEKWESALEKLLKAGIPKSRIRTYALIAFDSDPTEAWNRCEWIEQHGVMALPMWFHELDALEWNAVTEKQRELGWNEKERTKIMGWYYKHRGQKGERK